MRRLILLASTLALVACSPKPPQQTTSSSPPTPGVMCTMEARPAIQLTVLDQQGRTLAAGTNIRAIAELGGVDARRPPTPPPAPYSDTVSVTASGDSTTFGFAYERAGVYTVTVTAAGFRTFTAFDFYVEKGRDGCHVQTRRITAHLPR